MNFSKLGIYFCAMGIVLADLEEDYKREQLIPDVVDQVPEQLLKIIYNGKDFQVGQEMTPTEVQYVPDVEWNFDSSSIYTLIMTNPDSPTRENPALRDGLHWLVTNIPGDNFNKGESIVDYMSAGPPKNGGLHRYTFTVFKQPGKLVFDEPHIGSLQIQGRMKFNQRNFVNKYNLSNPIAGNMFQAEYDDFVLEFLKKIGFKA